ncbi:MAG: hypothetical protein K9J17_05520 [Flavobacteriales bacterium]|nr:hypothetical protein [Flavobacteriales bacterium]
MAANIHIGKLVQDRVGEMNLSIAEFGRRINKSRASVYHIYKSSSVDAELLLAISLVLEKNLFAPYLELLPDAGSEKALLCQIEELKKELELKDKLIALMEEKIRK